MLTVLKEKINSLKGGSPFFIFIFNWLYVDNKNRIQLSVFIYNSM